MTFAKEVHIGPRPRPHRQGDTLVLRDVRLKLTERPSLGLVDDVETEGALLSLWRVTPAGASAIGSAFLVVPGVAMTARHVVDDLDLADGVEGLFAVGSFLGKGRSWQVLEVIAFTREDVAILLVEPRFPVTPRVVLSGFPLRVAKLQPGERVAACGVVPARGQRPSRTVAMAPVCATGPVEDFYHTRGRALGEGPVHQLGVRTIGAMSGGPVLDQNGEVIGVVSTGMSPTDAPAVSFTALPWNALFHVLRPHCPSIESAFS